MLSFYVSKAGDDHFGGRDPVGSREKVVKSSVNSSCGMMPCDGKRQCSCQRRYLR